MHSVKGSLSALVALCVWSSFAKEMMEIEVLTSQPTKCTYEHAYDMYGAHCGGLRMSAVPSLSGSIEILDFSDNKLREIHSDTLSSYTSLKFLYLAENQIYFIDDNAFSSLTYLQSLDLSKNVITELPTAIFQLPSLRILYLGGNPLIHMSSGHIQIGKPIKAPLEFLDLSDCKIRELPDWGVLPQLTFYNISFNPLVSLEAEHFAFMCHLKKVDITKSIDKVDVCSIKPTVMWFTEKRVNFQLDDYKKLNSKEFDNCRYENISDMLNATYHKCKTEYLQIQSVKAMRRTWLTIGGGLAGFLVGFILLLYIMHRHNVARTKSTAEKMKQATPAHDGDKHATAVLLNDVS